jgi:predicted RNA binding protein YcfA (HicA-like mRNA interferase family)
MPERFSSREVAAVLARLGFKLYSQSGSHQKFRNEAGRVVIVPANLKQLPAGTFRSILRQAKIDLDQFKQAL